MKNQSIKQFLSEGYRAQWCLFVLFGGLVFLKCMLFHWFCFHSILLSSIFTNPNSFFTFWIGKIMPALFLSSFVFISKRTWWTIVAHVLIDLWIIANLFYFKANSLFLSYETIQMADNMDGFWSSLYMYMGWDIFIFPILTIIFVGLLLFLPAKFNKRNWILFGIGIATTLILSVLNNVMYSKIEDTWTKQEIVVDENMPSFLKNDHRFHSYYPFGQVYYWATAMEVSLSHKEFMFFYISKHSIISYFPACFIHDIWAPATGEIVPMSEEDIVRVSPLITERQEVSSSVSLVFILVESLESWPLHAINGIQYMPNMSVLINDTHTAYCERLISQVAHGNSADGQMIDMAGLLPIDNGATCRLYYKNTFPCLAQCYKESAIINPTPRTWKQNEMTEAYQFKNLIEPQEGESWEDEDVCKYLIQYIDSARQPFCALGITITSHTPFSYGVQHPKFKQEGMPPLMQAYLSALNYTDSCISTVLEHVRESDKLSKNTIVVISGDHTIFRFKMADFDKYAVEHNIDMQTMKTYTPMIVYSPFINESMNVPDVGYQMDIYPTILPLIGCEDYYWKGLGVNLLNTEERENRYLSAEEASRLSNKLIRSDYFANIGQ